MTPEERLSLIEVEQSKLRSAVNAQFAAVRILLMHSPDALAHLEAKAQTISDEALATQLSDQTIAAFEASIRQLLAGLHQ